MFADLLKDRERRRCAAPGADELTLKRYFARKRHLDLMICAIGYGKNSICCL